MGKEVSLIYQQLVRRKDISIFVEMVAAENLLVVDESIAASSDNGQWGDCREIDLQGDVDVPLLIGQSHPQV